MGEQLTRAVRQCLIRRPTRQEITALTTLFDDARIQLKHQDEAAVKLATDPLGPLPAGLDVFDKEPVDPENPLLKMSNVVARPHTAGTTWDTWARRAQFGFQNMERILRGEAPQAVVRDFDS